MEVDDDDDGDHHQLCNIISVSTTLPYTYTVHQHSQVERITAKLDETNLHFLAAYCARILNWNRLPQRPSREFSRPLTICCVVFICICILED